MTTAGCVACRRASTGGIRQQIGLLTLCLAGVTAVVLPQVLPRPVMCRKDPPRTARPVPIDDCLCHEPAVIERTTGLSRRIRHQRGNGSPLGIRKQRVTRNPFSILPKSHPLGIRAVIMTNGDIGGPVLSEIQNRIANSYGWDLLDKPAFG